MSSRRHPSDASSLRPLGSLYDSMDHDKLGLSSQFSMVQQDTNALMSEIGEFLGTLCDGASSPSSSDTFISSFFAGFRDLQQRCQEQTLTVAVLALTKSGVRPFSF